jgi:uncharacterized protein DUF5670
MSPERFLGTQYAPSLWSGRDVGKGVSAMLWAIVLVLLVLWVLGFIIIHITGALIHLLLLVAVVVLVYNLFVRSRRRV